VVTVRRAIGVLRLTAAFAVIAPACKPDLDQTVSIVAEPLVLAVRSDPPEALPREKVTYTALYVDGSGPVAKPAIDWAFCDARKPLAELGPTNTECLAPKGDWFEPLGRGSQVSGSVPSDACKNFGPDVPVPVMGQPPGRPVDPDSTGGYFQPLRVVAPGVDGADAITLAETRLSCGLADAPPEVAVDFGHRYHVNGNPSVDALSVVTGASVGAPLRRVGGAANPVTAGAHLTLRVAWARCPTTDACGDGVCGPDETSTGCPADCVTPRACTGAERFVAFDAETQALVDERESIGVAWFATGGFFDADRTGRGSADSVTTSDNGWTAPMAAGAVHLWVVLRDDRGGIGWAEYGLEVHRAP
jgi:hypothetical protein